MRRAAGVAAAVGAALFLTGADMMRPGPSPDSGLKGLWRVVEAKAARWANPRKLSKPDAPLLEFAVEFADERVKGPAPLGCDRAQYSSGVSYQNDMFGGRVANMSPDNFAKAVNISGGSPTTFRVVCGKSVRDFYVDDNTDLVFAEGDVVYTLQRPTGMDPEQYTAGYSGPSFDCARAQTAGEHIVCNDAELSQADRKMDAAYARLKRTETPESFATVRASQRAWLARLMQTCNANGKLPADTSAQNTIKDCLTDDYTSRADHLHAIEVAKAGPLTLEPRMRYFQRARPDTQESDITPWMSGGQPATAFNAWIAKTLQLPKRRMDDRQLFAFNDLPPDMKLSADRSYTVVRFDQKVASLQVSTYDYTGGAHEVLGESALNWDVAKGKPIALADVFRPGPAWRKFVNAYCLRDLHSQIAERQGSGPDASGIDPVVKDGANWLFAKDHAIVHFTVYAVASFADGEFDVEIPYKVLQPYLRPDAPVTP